MEKLAASLGVVGLSKSQVSAMAAELDEVADSFRNRPLDRGPYTFVWIDALTQKVREGGRTVENVHCLITDRGQRRRVPGDPRRRRDQLRGRRGRLRSCAA